jgi:hypothetical protein
MNMSFLDNEQLVQKMNFMLDYPIAVLLADWGCLWPQVFPADRKLVEELCMTSPYRWRQNTASVMGNASSLLRLLAELAATHGACTIRCPSVSIHASWNMLSWLQQMLIVSHVCTFMVAQAHEPTFSLNNYIYFAEKYGSISRPR